MRICWKMKGKAPDYLLWRTHIGTFLDTLYERIGCGADDDDGNEDNDGPKFALCYAYAAWIIFRIYKHL
jgi:hypothetical protein